MALRSRAAKRQPQLSTRPNYVRGFIQRVHRLLWMGYERMQPVGRFATWKEEELSEELANAMQTAIEEAGAPAWVHRFAIHCERPISLPSRRGKRRPRIDIELERTMVGRHPRFQFEAKRLRGKDTRAVAAYLGNEGLACFLSGTYAREWDEAGMLGYVQSRDPEHWASRIERRVQERRQVLHVTNGGDWVVHQIIPELSSTYRTFHDRTTVQRSIAIYHTLLVFRS